MSNLSFMMARTKPSKNVNKKKLAHTKIENWLTCRRSSQQASAGNGGKKKTTSALQCIGFTPWSIGIRIDPSFDEKVKAKGKTKRSLNAALCTFCHS